MKKLKLKMRNKVGLGVLGELGRMLRRMLPERRHYLLMDGLNSCAYIPRHTYGYLNKLMLKELERNPKKAENSLRFVWARCGGRYVLAINPGEVGMTQMHGLTTDNMKRVLIPCPYVQQIYQAYSLEPERCGKMYLKELKIKNEQLKNKPWLALFELKV